MKIDDDGNYIDLRKITVPLPIIDAEKDDLVTTDQPRQLPIMYPAARKKASLRILVIMWLYALVMKLMRFPSFFR